MTPEQKILGLIEEYGEEMVRKALEDLKRQRLKHIIWEIGEGVVEEVLDERRRERFEKLKKGYEESLKKRYSIIQMHACEEAEA